MPGAAAHDPGLRAKMLPPDDIGCLCVSSDDHYEQKRARIILRSANTFRAFWVFDLPLLVLISLEKATLGVGVGERARRVLILGET